MASKNKSADTVIAEAALAKDTSGQSPLAVATPSSGWGEYSGLGTGHLTAEEKSIPFLILLQSNNPEVEKQTVPGAKAGMFLNSVTKELIPGNVGLIIQPVYADRSIVEWKDRDKGGGLVGRHSPTSPEALEAKDANGGSFIGTKERPVKRGENFMVDTRYLYANILTDDGEDFTGGYFILGASKSKIKPTQGYLTAIDMLRGKPPLFAARARLTSVVEIQKGSGKEYHNVRFMPFLEGKTHTDCLLPQGHPLLLAGFNFYKAVTGGTMKADFDKESFEGPADEAAEEKRHF